MGKHCMHCGALMPPAPGAARPGERVTAQARPASTRVTLPPMGPKDKRDLAIFGGGLLCLLLLGAVFFRGDEPKSSPSPPPTSAVSSDKEPLAPKVLAQDAVGCSSEAAVEQLTSVAGDERAIGGLLLSGRCEVVRSGTELKYEGGLLVRRYRVVGTTRVYFFPGNEKFR